MKRGINTIVGGAVLLQLFTPTEAAAHWPDGHLSFWGETWHAVQHFVGGVDGTAILAAVAILLLVGTIVRGSRSETGEPNSEGGVG